ncbi:MAG: hypothetical protein B6D45_01365 [Ignavibacteriales bacterium UTCHB3]|nr:MAG: hypothetical protein B6D45_01365 [Ignavibacteriales bacterium UTCHB3]
MWQLKDEKVTNNLLKIIRNWVVKRISNMFQLKKRGRLIFCIKTASKLCGGGGIRTRGKV